MNHEIVNLIKKADLAIQEERFEDLIEFYTEDAILVIHSGRYAVGKEEIKKAFMAIARYFKNSIVPTQGKMIMLETKDTILVMSQTFLQADEKKDTEYSMDRKATYVYRKVNGQWLCAIDNSYGTTLLNE